MTDDPKAPENPEEGLSFPGDEGNPAERAIIDDTTESSDENERERDDDAPLSDPRPTG